MELKDVVERLSEIAQLIAENTEDREREANRSEHSRNKEVSESSYVNYSGAGINIDQLMHEYSALIAIISESIAKINNVMYRRILKKKYIDRKSIRSIAKEVGYSYGYMCSIVSAAEQKLQNILHDMS